jgi:hypothetical protein
LTAKNPNDIKFMFRYGLFQLKILSSENDCFESLRRIQLAFESKHSKKTGSAMNEFMTET